MRHRLRLLNRRILLRVLRVNLERVRMSRRNTPVQQRSSQATACRRQAVLLHLIIRMGREVRRTAVTMVTCPRIQTFFLGTRHLIRPWRLHFK